MKIEGEASYIDVKGKRHSIEGMGDLPNNIKLKFLKVEGTIDFEDIICEKISIEGECNGDKISCQNFSAEGEVEIDEIKVEKTFKVDGIITAKIIRADKIVIQSRADSIDEIFCNDVKIFEDTEKIGSNYIFSKIFGLKTSPRNNKSRIKIKNLRAEKVSLQNCEVEKIECKNAVIDSNCAVEKLIVEGNYKIAESSKVSEIVTKPFS